MSPEVPPEGAAAVGASVDGAGAGAVQFFEIAVRENVLDVCGQGKRVRRFRLLH